MKWIMPFFLIASAASADSVLPNPEETHNRMMSDDQVLTGEYEYKKRYATEAQRAQQLQSQMETARLNMIKNAQAGAKSDLLQGGTSKRTPTVASGPRKQPSTTRFSNLSNTQPPIPDRYVQTFSVSDSDTQKTILPAASAVKVTALTGVEAGNEPLPMVVELDYTFAGPNHTVVDLRNCRFVLKARGDVSNERVCAETTTLSCVRENGEHFTRPARGFLVGEDSTACAIGPIVSKQGQAIAAAAGLTAFKGIGEAIGLTESSSQLLSVGNAVEKATNVTGNKGLYIAGKAGMDAASLIAKEALEAAKKFQPSVGLGSGRSLWVVMLDSVEVPTLSNSESEEE